MGLWLGSSRVMLDGAGHTVTGSQTSGSSHIGVKTCNQCHTMGVKNLTIKNFGWGIASNYATGLTVTGTTIENVGSYAIKFFGVDGLKFESNNISNSPIDIQAHNAYLGVGNGSCTGTGEYVSSSSDGPMVIKNNVLTGTGFYIEGSNYCIDGNNISNAPANAGIYIAPISPNAVELGTNHKITNNVITGSISAGIRIVSNADGNTITGNTIKDGLTGIQLDGSDNNSISGNTINNNKPSNFGLAGTSQAMSINTSNNNSITNNQIMFNSQGVELNSSSFNQFNSNTIENTEGNGLRVLWGEANKIMHNSANWNGGTGILIENSNNPIDNVSEFDGNTASGNTIADIVGISTGPSPSTTPPSAIGSPTSITGFEFPNGVAVDNFGNIYVADTRTDTVKKFNPSKELLFEISGFNELFDVGVDNSGYIYTLDQGSNTVKKYDPSGSFLSQKSIDTSFIGDWDGGTYNGSVSSLSVVDNYVYVTHRNPYENGAVVKLDLSLNQKLKIPVYYPTSVTADSSGNIYVYKMFSNPNTSAHLIQKYSSSGNFILEFGGPCEICSSSAPHDGLGKFTSVYGMDIDSSGKIYVAEHGTKRVQILGNSGNVIKWFNSGTDNFGRLNDVTVDTAGNIYVADIDNKEIVILPPNYGHLAVTDFSPPTVNVPSNQNLVTLNVNDFPLFTWTVTASDDVGVSNVNTCNPDGTWYVNQIGGGDGTNPVHSIQFPVGTTTVTCTATDLAGNIGSASFTVTVELISNPIPVVNVPNDILVYLGTPNISFAVDTLSVYKYTGTTIPVFYPEPTAFVVDYGGVKNVDFTVTATDDDLSSGPTCSHSSGSSFPIGNTTVTCTATDIDSGVGTASFVVSIVANTVVGNPTCNVPSNTQFAVGSSHVSCSIQDQNGIVTEDMFTVNVQPKTPLTDAECRASAGGGHDSDSVFVCEYPFDVTVEEGQRLVWVDTQPWQGFYRHTITSVDGLFDHSDTGKVDMLPSGWGGIGTYKFYDKLHPNAPSSMKGSITIAPADTTSPTVNVPNTLTVSTQDANGTPTVTYSITATDDRDVVSGPSCNKQSGSSFQIGTTTVTCTASDAAGNTGTSSFNVKVEYTFVDETAPGFASYDDISQSTTNPAGTTVSFTLPTATDNVAVTNGPTCDAGSGSMFNVGTTVVTCYASDAAGNIASMSFNVAITQTFVDNTAPAITITPQTARSNLISTDDDYAIVSAGSSAGGTFAFMVSAVDNIGVTVGPTCSSNGSIISLSYNAATNLHSSQPHSPGTLFPVGTSIISCTASDGTGNTGTALYIVSVMSPDTTPPTITVPNNITIQSSGHPQGTDAGRVIPQATDNVDSGGNLECVFNWSDPSFDPGYTLHVGGWDNEWSLGFFPDGTSTVTCTATDAAGNTGSASFDITVTSQTGSDTTPPTINLPYDLVNGITLTASDSSGAIIGGSALGNINSISASDNSGYLADWRIPGTDSFNPDWGATAGYSGGVWCDNIGMLNGSTFIPIGTTTITCKAWDNSENEATASFTITVTSQTASSSNFAPEISPIIGSAQYLADTNQQAHQFSGSTKKVYVTFNENVPTMGSLINIVSVFPNSQNGLPLHCPDTNRSQCLSIPYTLTYPGGVEQGVLEYINSTDHYDMVLSINNAPVAGHYVFQTELVSTSFDVYDPNSSEETISKPVLTFDAKYAFNPFIRCRQY